jgi:hypothetical protein
MNGPIWRGLPVSRTTVWACRSRGAARPHDQTGPLVRNLAGLQTGVFDRLRHRDEIEGAAIAHEPQVAFVDVILKHDVGAA